MPGPQPRILDALGDELVRAARAQETAGGRRRNRWRTPRAVAATIGALLVLAGAAVAAGLVIGRGDPIPPAPVEQVPPELRPAPGTAQLNGLDVADPDGGPAWDVRTSRSPSGAVCVAVGQVLDGDFGLVGLDRRFRALPTGAADTCSAPRKRGATVASARAFRGGGRLSAITVVSGVVAPGVRDVRAVGAGGTRRLALGPDGAFLTIFPGAPEQARPRLVFTEADGEHSTLRFADTGEYLAPDPSGGAPWTITRATHNARPGVRCIQTARQRGADSPTPLDPRAEGFNPIPASVPPRCGRRGSTFVDVQRFVPRRQTHGTDSWWGLNVARTIAWGAVAHAGSVVTLHAPGPERRVPVDRRTNGFVVVLDGRVDPRSVRLTVDGRPLDAMTGVTGRRGNPLPRRVKTPPAWRSPEAVAKASGRATPYVVDRKSVRTAHRVEDPTGGAPWAMRAWRTRGNADRTLACFAIGHPGAGDTLTLPEPGGGNRIVAIGGPDEAFCNPPSWLRTHAAGALVRVEVDDPDAVDPQPQRTVVSGLLGAGVRSAELLGAGAPRALDLGQDGTFLLVLDGTHAFADLRVRQVRDDGRVRTTKSDGLEAPCRLQPGRHVIAADPDGQAPWVFGRSTVGNRTCSYTARIITGRLAYLSPEDGTVHAGPGGFSSAPPGSDAPRTASRRDRIELRVESPDQAPGRAAPATPPAPAQVARRTLPGRTLVLGDSGPDIVAVTLRTPRDVRTLNPVDGRFFAVYDGAFYTGEIVATGYRRDGTTVTVRRPATYP